MYETLLKRGSMISFLVGGLISLLYIIIAMNQGAGDLASLPREEQIQSNAFNFGLRAAIFMVGLGFFLWAAFGIKQVASNPKAYMKGIIFFAALVILYFILYATASTDMDSAIAGTIDKFHITATVSKEISAAIMTGLILAGIGLLSIVILEIINLRK